MRRFVLNIAILTVSALLVFAIVQNYISFRDRQRAELCRDKYLWNKAEKFFRKSISANPYNSNYYSDYADFLLYQSNFSKNTGELLLLAGDLYARAYSLNPCWREYPLKIAQVKIRLTGIAGKEFPKTLGKLSEEAMEFFRKAYANDPNGFNTSYVIGYYGIQIYNILRGNDKDFIAGRLKYSLNERPWYSVYIYPIVWNSTKQYSVLEKITPDTLITNELLFLFMTQDPELIKQWHGQYKKIQELKQNADTDELNGKKARIEEIKDKLLSVLDEANGKNIDGSIWVGISEQGDQDISGGNMFFNGIVFGAAGFSPGKSEIKISAKGAKSDDMWPYMIVLLDDEIIGETFVKTDDWSEYSFSINSDGGPKIISIMFINDGGNEKEDRNLYIGDAWVEKIK